MNKKLLLIGAISVLVLSLAVVHAYAIPHSDLNAHMNQQNACRMNRQGTAGGMMNGQSMNSQQCQQRMGPMGNQITNGQAHRQYCQQYIGPDNNITT